jgi:hypothetical protein
MSWVHWIRSEVLSKFGIVMIQVIMMSAIMWQKYYILFAIAYAAGLLFLVYTSLAIVFLTCRKLVDDDCILFAITVCIMVLLFLTCLGVVIALLMCRNLYGENNSTCVCANGTWINVFINCS